MPASRLQMLLSFLIGTLLLAACGPLQLCEATDYYVTPTDSANPECPVGEPCFTFNHYAQEFNNTSYQDGAHNFTLIFLHGVHNLTHEFNIRNSNTLILRSMDNDSSKVVIFLNASFTSTFMGEGVTFKALTINGIGKSHDNDITLFQPQENPNVLELKISIEQVVFTAVCTKIYIHSLATDVEVLVNDSEFFCSIIGIGVKLADHIYINISSSIFYSGGVSPIQISAVNISPRFALQVLNTTVEDVPTHRLPMDAVCYIPRDAFIDSFCDLYVFVEWVNGHVVPPAVNIVNSSFTLTLGAGLCIITSQYNELHVEISDSTISNHQSGGIFVAVNGPGAGFYPDINITISNCKVLNNTSNGAVIEPSVNIAPAAGVLSINTDAAYVARTTQIVVLNLTVVIANSSFTNNRVHEKSAAVISVFRISHQFILQDCQFVNNTGSPIMAYQSTLTLSGNVSFVGNTANKGGALSIALSTVNIANGSNIVFQDNFATDVGGGIYIEQFRGYLLKDNDVNVLIAGPCFYQLMGYTDSTSTEYYYHYSLYFANNTAQHGGADVFGTSLQSFCTCTRAEKDFASMTSVAAQKYFHLHPNQTSAQSAVSSEPTRVCFCDLDGEFNCANASEIFRNISVAPGEQFNVSAVIVGVEFGTTTGSVYAQFLPLSDPNAHSAALSPRYQYSQGVSDHTTCTQLNYTVYSANLQQHMYIALSALDGTIDYFGGSEEILENIEEDIDTFNRVGVIPPNLLTTPVYIEVTLLPCPIGFTPEGHPPGCVCYPVFNENYISCSISGGGIGYVTRNGTLWVNASFGGSVGDNSTGVFVHKYCPFGYCKSQEVTLDLNHPDAQCAFNRSGTLCGACKEGYSLALGGSKCLQCPNNNNLALLLLFAFAGILLVFFIKILDLTVTHGTINGLIFYANIVWANQSILFPNDGTTTGANIFFKTFIAWLNLDFGFETCFVQGLNGYWKTWLQFVFPFYIWSIAGVIIITSRHSALLTKLFGNNSVPVLATLFLLSYSKLLRTIISAMNVTYLVDYPNGFRLAVWTLDGNLKYCGVPHIFLFVFALAALLILWLPYTSTLLSVQLLRRVSEWKMFRWVDRMKPFFDAYFSPFKDRHHYWVGVQLVARGILLVTFSLTSANVPSANFLAMVAVSVALFFSVAQTGHVYKNKIVSFLETTLLLNLVLLGGGALYTDPTGGNKAALIFTSVGVSFVQFAIVVSFHLWKSVRSCYRKLKQPEEEEYENLDDQNRRERVDHDQRGLQAPDDYSKLREPLLESM